MKKQEVSHWRGACQLLMLVWKLESFIGLTMLRWHGIIKMGLDVGTIVTSFQPQFISTSWGLLRNVDSLSFVWWDPSQWPFKQNFLTCYGFSFLFSTTLGFILLWAWALYTWKNYWELDERSIYQYLSESLSSSSIKSQKIASSSFQVHL